MINKLDFYEFIFDLRGNKYSHPDYWGIRKQLIDLNQFYLECWNDKGFVPISLNKFFEFARIVEESKATDELAFLDIWQDYFAYPKYPIHTEETPTIKELLPTIIDKLDDLEELRKGFKIIEEEK